jgi:hypothetical protein
MRDTYTYIKDKHFRWLWLPQYNFFSTLQLLVSSCHILHVEDDQFRTCIILGCYRLVRIGTGKFRKIRQVLCWHLVNALRYKMTFNKTRRFHHATAKILATSNIVSVSPELVWQ